MSGYNMSEEKTNKVLASNSRSHLHKVHNIGGRLVVVIDDALASSLAIDDSTWLDEGVFNGDLLLRITRQMGD
jgi:hypothetical protein